VKLRTTDDGDVEPSAPKPPDTLELLMRFATVAQDAADAGHYPDQRDHDFSVCPVCKICISVRVQTK
jgi:hypothetical protein